MLKVDPAKLLFFIYLFNSYHRGCRGARVYFTTRQRGFNPCSSQFDKVKSSYSRLIEMRYSIIVAQVDHKWRCSLSYSQCVHYLGGQLVFLQDWASSQYALPVRQYLDHRFPNRWIGRRGPIEWPTRLPDLSPLDFYGAT